MKIRNATVEDSKWILRHRVEMFRDMGESDDALELTRKMTEEFLQSNWIEEYHYFLVEEDDTIIAGCGLSTFQIPPQASQPSGIYGYLSNMYVEPDYRRKRVGIALVDFVIEYCKREGIGLLLLHASKNGLPLYYALGFRNQDHLMHLRTSDYGNSTSKILDRIN